MSGTKNYFIQATLDSDDVKMNTPEIIMQMDTLNKLANRPVIRYVYGTSKCKVHAINRDMDAPDMPHFDILVNMSDDMLFRVQDFDLRIIADMEKNFPAYDGCLHYYDGSPKGGNQQEKANGELLMTMSIMGECFYHALGYIYHPDYTSVWCDNEATDVAKMLNKYFYSDQVLFEHMHPAHAKSLNDEQYTHTESFFNIDKLVYERRKAINFEIEKICFTKTDMLDITKDQAIALWKKALKSNKVEKSLDPLKMTLFYPGTQTIAAILKIKKASSCVNPTYILSIGLANHLEQKIIFDNVTVTISNEEGSELLEEYDRTFQLFTVEQLENFI